MLDRPFTRRRLLTTAAAGATAAHAFQSGLTAGQIVERIKENVGVPWREQTVDKVVAGSPDTVVKGVATTMMSTLDVLQRASAAGRNMVITHEPTFFAHLDDGEGLKQDETYLAKLDFIKRNNMAVFRFHDHWHARRPDGINAGMARELGWDKNVSPDSPRVYVFEPAQPLARFARNIEQKLNARSLRVLGDPRLPIRRVGTSWGYGSQIPAMRMISRPDIDALVVGETREWEVVEYVDDMVAAGKKKALIVIGHILSEQSGMKLCAEWLKGFVPEVPIEFIAAAEPFWHTSRPPA